MILSASNHVYTHITSFTTRMNRNNKKENRRRLCRNKATNKNKCSIRFHTFPPAHKAKHSHIYIIFTLHRPIRVMRFRHFYLNKCRFDLIETIYEALRYGILFRSFFVSRTSSPNTCDSIYAIYYGVHSIFVL